jgi:DNA modification methylase
MTSPPYWGLRAYGSTPQIWDGDVNCKHEFTDESYVRNNDKTAGAKQRTVRGSTNRDEPIKHGFCIHCNAWKGELGLEPTYELYIKHLCDIFDEIKRVLKKSGTCWVNIGDSYQGSWGTFSMDVKTKAKRAGTNKRPPMSYRNDDVSNKSLVLIPQRFAIEMVSRGWILRNTIIWYKRNCMAIKCE